MDAKNASGGAIPPATLGRVLLAVSLMPAASPASYSGAKAASCKGPSWPCAVGREGAVGRLLEHLRDLDEMAEDGALPRLDGDGALEQLVPLGDALDPALGLEGVLEQLADEPGTRLHLSPASMVQNLRLELLQSPGCLRSIDGLLFGCQLDLR